MVIRYALLMLLDTRKFESRKYSGDMTLESGVVATCNGEQAVVLGCGFSRSEAKKNGTAYYNAVAALLGEDEEWTFETQNLDEIQSPGYDFDREDDSEGPSRKRRKL